MKKKIKHNFVLSIIFSILLVIVVSFFDFFKYPDSFWMYSIALGFIASIFYYIFRRDFSESLAVLLVFLIMLNFGFEDLIFYIPFNLFFCVQGVCGFPETMPHLTTHPIIGSLSKLFGFVEVTPISLCISVFIGALLSASLVYFLWKQKW